MKSLLIKNGTIVTAYDEFLGDIYVEDEKIVVIGKTLDYQADEIIDATGKYVVPGGVDQHTHFNFTFGEHTCVGWESSDAGIVSGTTTVIDFANQKVGSSLKDSIDEFIEENDFDEVKLRLEDTVDLKNDSVYVFTMSKKELNKAGLIGQAFDKELVTDEIISKFF